MSTESSTPPADPGFPQRAIPLCLTIVVALLTLKLIAGTESSAVFATLGYGLLLLPTLVAAVLLGLAATHPFRALFREGPAPALFRMTTSCALGFGVIALMTLLMGSLHWTTPYASLVPLLLSLAGLPAARVFLRDHPVLPFLTARAHRGEWLFLPASVPAAMLFLAATFPPGSLWNSEGRGYDVLEYHLQLPREYGELHSTAPLAHNVYSYFPANIEMLYLHLQQFSSLAIGDNSYLWGTYPSQFLHSVLMLLTAAALASIPLLNAQLTATGRAAAVLLFLGTPWTIVTGSLAYNEGGILLFGTLALGVALAPSPNAPKRRGILAGLLLGLAVGCKLTAGIYFALPIAFILVARSFRARGHLVTLALAVAVAVATFAPWGVRTALGSRGNPVFPLATSLLGDGPFTPAQAAAFDKGHTAPESLRPLAARIHALTSASLLDPQWSPSLLSRYDWTDTRPPEDAPTRPLLRVGLLWWLLPLALALAFINKTSRPAALFLLAILGIQLACWLFLTHLQSRFLLPLAIPLALLFALAVQGHPLRREFLPLAGLRVLVATGIAVHALCTIFLLLPEAHLLGGPVHPDNLPAPALPIGQLHERQINVAAAAALTTRPDLSEPPTAERVLLVGDATAFRYASPVSYATVFDTQPLSAALATPDPVATLRAQDIHFVLLHWPEIERLHRTYGFDPEITPALLPKLKAMGLVEVPLASPGLTLLRVPN